MKVVFLDFDGPIIPTRAFAMNPGMSFKEPCRTSGSLINEVLKRTDAHLVISSTWRRYGFQECATVLKKAGIDLERLGDDWKTESLHHLSREDEITKWMEKHAPPGSDFIAIDDMPLDKLESKHRVQCTTNDGFLFEHYLEACEKLGISPFAKPTVIL
jgi:hypothetical protein